MINVVNFFESSTASLETQNGAVTIKQESQFPKVGSTKISLTTPSDWTGILNVRVPTWSEGFTIKLDGNNLRTKLTNGYMKIEINGSSEHVVDVNFRIPLTTELLSDNSYALKRGPEVLSIDLRDNNDTWIGKSDLTSIPNELTLSAVDQEDPWPGFKKTPERRRYRIRLDDRRTTEGMDFTFTPYADAGNDGAAFRTVFPLTLE